MIYKQYTKLYGPYTRKDGRKIVILRDDSKNQITLSYSKYIVECALNRYLSKDETVDHIDGDFDNNDLTNLRVVLRNLHALSHVSRRLYNTAHCPLCGNEYVLTADRRKTCGSKHCVGLSTHLLGYNKGNNLSSHDEEIVSYESRRSALDSYPSVADQLKFNES